MLLTQGHVVARSHLQSRLRSQDDDAKTIWVHRPLDRCPVLPKDFQLVGVAVDHVKQDVDRYAIPILHLGLHGDSTHHSRSGCVPDRQLERAVAIEEASGRQRDLGCQRFFAGERRSQQGVQERALVPLEGPELGARVGWAHGGKLLRSEIRGRAG
jgi:hypothetical protein